MTDIALSRWSIMKPLRLQSLVVAALALACVASACSSSSDEQFSSSVATETTITLEAGSAGTERDVGANSDAEVDSGADSGPGTEANGGSATILAPMTAAEAIALHGPLEQAWTGPLTEDLVCAEFPLEHVLAVLGLTEDRIELDSSFDCQFLVDGQDYAAILTVSIVENEQDWLSLLDATVPADARLPLNVADEGVVSNGDRPWAAVRDGALGWKVVTGGVNSDDVFKIDAVLMEEFMTILTTRFSASNEQGEPAPQESADGDADAEPVTSDEGAIELPTRDELEQQLTQFAPMFGWTETDIACLADELTALTATDPDFLEEAQFVLVYQTCGVLDSALVVAASTYLPDGDGQCLVDALSEDELVALATAALIEGTDAESEAAFEAAFEDHPECAG